MSDDLILPNSLPLDTPAWEVIVGPDLALTTRLTPQQLVQLTDKKVLKLLLDKGLSKKLEIVPIPPIVNGPPSVVLYALAFRDHRQLFYMSRDDMIRYKMRPMLDALELADRQLKAKRAGMN